MSDERSERRSYRKSPGRQYAYDYDPLHSKPLNGNGQSGRLSATPQSEPLTGYLKDAETGGQRRHTGVLAPRPDPRRTRQLLRQQILAAKAKSALAGDTGQIDPNIDMSVMPFDEDQLTYEEHYRPRRRSGSIQLPSRPLNGRHPTREYTEPDELYETIAPPPPPLPYDDEYEYVDPDMGYDEEVEQALPDPETERRRRTPVVKPDIEEEESQRVRQKKGKKGFFSRRKLIAGAILVGGGAVAAYELGPKIPQALENAGTNIGHEIQQAFDQGFAAGGQAVRKELINGLDTLEGVSLDAAIGAAKLTRVAYDVFVSPIIKLASNIADDFLSALLAALIKARGWLQQINADNATLVALTSVLQNWVNQVHIMPKKLQTITDTDLDGAQTYLNALQRTIQQQQAILNGQATPTPKAANPTAPVTPGPNTTATPGT